MKFIIPLITLLFTINVHASEAPVAQEKPAMIATTSVIVTAVVEAINHETRAVTLKRADGEIIKFTVGDEARNLPQVSVGDLVSAEYMETISIQVLAAENAEAGVAELSAMARSEEGEMPAAGVIETIVTVATVEAINIEANTFKLKGPDGEVKEYTARNPENLKASAVGDIVVSTFTQALAISVEKAPSE